MTEPRNSIARKATTNKERGDLQIMDLMMQNEFQLLNIICHGSLSGDNAATASKGILKILTQKDTKVAVSFIQKVFSERIKYYRFKSKDIADITRDNGLVTMLLVAFEQSEGVEYLKNLLSQTLNEQVGKLEECEMDIVKIKQQKPTFTDDELNEQLTQNRLRLESSCQMIFDHIFASYDMVPRSIRKMCTFLTRTIESTGEAGEVDSAAAQFKSGMSKTISAQRHNTMLGSHAMLGSHTSASNSSLFKNANNASHLTEKAPAPNGSTELSSPPPPQQQKKRQGTRLREEIKINESAEEEDSYPNSPREGKSLSSVKPPSLNGSEGSKGKGIMGSGSSGMLKSGSKIASSTSGPNLSSANEVRTLKSQLAELKSHDMPRSVSSKDVKGQKFELTASNSASNFTTNKSERKISGVDRKAEYQKLIGGSSSTSGNSSIMEKKVSTPMLEGNVETVPGMPLLITEIPETKDTEPPSANPDPTPNDATPSKESDTESPSNILATESTPLKETDGKSPHVLSTEPTPKEMHSENSRKEAAFDPFAIENSYSDLMDRKVSTSSQSSRDTILKPWVKQVSVTVKRRNENSMSFNTRPLSMDLDTEFYAKSKSELPNLQIEVPKIQLPDTEGKEGERKNSSEINREDTVENPNIHQAQSEAAGSEQQPDLDPVETVGELRKEVEKALTREITLGKAMIERSKSNLALAKTKSNIALAKTKSNIALAIVETPEVESAAAKKAEADEEGDYVAPVLQSHSRKSMVLNNLSISEKVVGSFLFLRFIVPAIATPERYGIVMEKLNPDIRRGLVLCSKMMTALCNDKEFGSKDSLLIPCNNFLKPYRYPMKQFIVDCTRRPIPSLEIIPEALIPSVMPVNTEQKDTMVKEESTNSYAKEESTNSYILSNASKNSSKWSLGKSINQTKSIKGASNDNRNTLTPASPVLKSVSIDAATGITNDSDVTALLYTLSKNMKKLELDVEVRAKYLGEEQQKDIDVRFKQFRDLLALHYTAVARNPSKSVSKKSQENLKEKGLMMRSLNILRKWLRRKRTSTP